MGGVAELLGVIRRGDTKAVEDTGVRKALPTNPTLEIVEMHCEL